MKRYAVTVRVEHLGRIQHVTKARDEADALAKVQRAYLGRACSLVKIQRVIE